ncbi:MAG: EpsG family protein [Prevotellaceae bacterium]|jgi:hypothetical protein|nr:EpsG family protein [Prevotellaceae bacterium]
MVKKTSIILWSLFVLLLFFSGFRWDVGIDWKSYVNSMQNEALLEHYEFGNLLIRNLLHSYGYVDGRYWLWVMALLTLFFFFYSIKQYSVNPAYSAILFICLGPYWDSLNGVRQFLSIALFAYSWQFLIHKQFIRYAITILVASCFHFSALMLLPIYFMARIKFRKKVLINLFMLTIPLSFFLPSVLSQIASLFSRYEVYATSKFIQSNPNVLSNLRCIFPTILFIVCMVLYDKLKEKNIVFLNLSLIYIFLTMLFPNISLMIRIGFYFQVAFIFLIPLINQCVSRMNGQLFNVFVICYGSAFIFITQLSRPVSNIIPFELKFDLLGCSLLLILALAFACAGIFIKITHWKDHKAIIKHK